MQYGRNTGMASGGHVRTPREVGYDGSCTVIRQHICWYVSKVTER